MEEEKELKNIEHRAKLRKNLEAKGILYISRANQRLGDVLNTPNADTLHNILLFYDYTPTAPDILPLDQLIKMAIGRDNCIFLDLELLLRDQDAEIPDAIRSLEGYPKFGARLITMRGRDQLMTLDCVTAEIEKMAICTARIEHAQQIEVGAVPSADQQLLPCVLPCPLRKSLGGKCPDDDFVWGCDDCGQTISFVKQEEAPITHLFCACGRTSVDEFTFRCAYFTTHSNGFSHFPSKALLDKQLETLNNAQNGQQAMPSTNGNVSDDQKYLAFWLSCFIARRNAT